MNWKKTSNYVALSLTRIMKNEEYENELVHFCAVRFVNDRAKEYLDLYIENSKKEYDQNLNKKAYPLVLILAMLHTWFENDIIILHDGGRKDMEWLSEELNRHTNLQIRNQFINVEDLAVFEIGLQKTSLKNIAKHFGVYRVNTSTKVSRDAHNCMLINEIWKAFKDSQDV
ncbi:hypothetical protein J2Z62_000333 [Mycoplasmoides fastidiosum]|uniref:Uncharacterized protein n=1 Tax=Mycoplasmoides fastidiosum TaxID=92758 RepID=A0ABU0LYY3_9BACT|nr:hypothetical protein [Mycoplasmoides fastidiosum]MDQ0513895.1 hypothetical protein [Mycoplasmoides fastidiosum]UUD37691.1 hypothetical protein NPA10_03930 [Mycoplasmoides fastidiosum]